MRRHGTPPLGARIHTNLDAGGSRWLDGHALRQHGCGEPLSAVGIPAARDGCGEPLSAVGIPAARARRSPRTPRCPAVYSHLLARPRRNCAFQANFSSSESNSAKSSAVR